MAQPNPFLEVLEQELTSMFPRGGTAPFTAPVPTPRPEPNVAPPASKARSVGVKPAQAGPATMTDVPKGRPTPETRAATAQAEIEAGPLFGARQAFFEGMVRRGMPPIAAAGFTGSIEAESDFNPLIEGDINPKTGKPRSFGSGQVQRSRKKALFQFAEDNNQDPNNIETQMDFMIHEMQTTEQPAARRMFEAKTVEEAAAAAITFFRPSEPRAERRLENALKVQMKGEEPGTAPGTPATEASAKPVRPPRPPAPPRPGPSAGHPVTRPQPQRPVTRTPLRPTPIIGPPTLAQHTGTPNRSAVPVAWQQAVTKYLQSRDPKDLAVVPKGSMPVLLTLMGQAARRTG